MKRYWPAFQGGITSNWRPLLEFRVGEKRFLADQPLIECDVGLAFAFPLHR